MSDTTSLQAAVGDRYVIERELGAGGMATVYLARDLKYDRLIALKVLRPDLAAVLGAERFLNEIRVTAQLEHPHIVTLLDSGESGGFLWYALPYIRGESLRDKLTRERQLGIDEALTITTQVAGALDYAHGQGVVHRDIKPENILLHEGEAMLADFGIALAVREAGGNRLTETGLSLGTPQYMSPEQATGDRILDARSDVYSLGAVLYEMLTGEPPVTGPTVQAIIAKLLTERPISVRTVRDTVPTGVDNALAKALAKVPADRFASAGSFARTLADAQRVTSASSERRSVRRWMPATIALGVVAMLGAGGLAIRVVRSRTPDLKVRDRVQVTFTGEATLPAISADGTQLAYVVRRCTATTCAYGVEVQDIGGSASRRVFDGATALYNVQWSPDRRFLLISATIGEQFGTYILSTLGGAPRFIGTGGATFFPSGDSLLLASTPTDRVPRVWTTTLDGDRRDSTVVGGVGERLWLAAVMPGGRSIVANVTNKDAFQIRVFDRQGRRRDVYEWRDKTSTVQSRVSADALWFKVFQPGSAPATLVRLALDPASGRFGARLDTVMSVSREDLDVAADGRTVAYVEGTTQYGVWALEMADALRGRFAPERLLASATSPTGSAISPDGGHVMLNRAVAGADGRAVVAIVPWAGGAEVRHMPSGTLFGFGWLPDGERAFYGERANSKLRMVTIDARSGARRNVFVIPDSLITTVAPLGNTGWVWIPYGELFLSYQRVGDASRVSLPMPSGVGEVWGVRGSPEGSRIATLSWSVANDSMTVHVATLPDGHFTRWAAFLCEAGTVAWQGDGSLLVSVDRSAGIAALYRIRGPGRVESLGTIPRPVEGISASLDGRRISLRTRETRGDVWLAHIGKAR